MAGRRTIWVLAVVPLALIALATKPGIGQAQDAPLELRVRQLETQVAGLVARVRSLELALRPGEPVASGKAGWRHLRVGMTEDEVRGLLGDPKRIEVVGDLAKTRWYYNNAATILKAHVIFGLRTGLVTGWRAPK